MIEVAILRYIFVLYKFVLVQDMTHFHIPVKLWTCIVRTLKLPKLFILKLIQLFILHSFTIWLIRQMQHGHHICFFLSRVLLRICK